MQHFFSSDVQLFCQREEKKPANRTSTAKKIKKNKQIRDRKSSHHQMRKKSRNPNYEPITHDKNKNIWAKKNISIFGEN